MVLCYILEVIKPPSEDEDEMDSNVELSDSDGQEKSTDEVGGNIILSK